MISIERTDLYDTYARHLCFRLGGFKMSLSYVSLLDEGCDQKLVRFLASWSHDAHHCLAEAGITRDHLMLINQKFHTTPWRLTGRAFGFHPGPKS